MSSQWNRRSAPVTAAVLLALYGTVDAQESGDDSGAARTLPKVRVEAAAEGYTTQSISTATKTDTPLLEVPQSVSVITQDLIQDQAMQSLTDVIRYAPGVGAAQGEGNRDNPIFRGNASTADLFVDGIRDDVEYFRDLYNVERVEVLKGPNGMMFGRGAVGGLINRVTRWANREEVREATLQAYSEGGGRTTADFGTAIGDSLGLRVTGLYEDSDSYRDEVTFERMGVNPTMSFALGENATLRLGYEYYDYDRTADRGIPSFNGRPSDSQPETFFGDPDQSTTGATVNAATAVFEYRFANGASLTNRTRWADYDKEYWNVYAVTPVTDGLVGIEAYGQENQRENLFNQTDLVLDFRTGGLGHTLLVGMELGTQDSDNRRDNGLFDFGGGVPPVTVPASNDQRVYVPFDNPRTTFPVDFAHVPTAASANPAFNHIETTQASLYVQDQIKFSPHWQAIVGVRYDNLEIEFNNLNPPTATTPAQIVTKDELISPRAGLIYQPTETLSLYASYTMASLPRAGAQMTSLAPTNEAFDPEEWENAEVGLKWDVRPDLSATLAIYQLDRTNVIAPDPNNPTQSILVDGQRTRGVELGLTGRITEAWSIAGGYAYQEAEVTETQSATVVDGARVGQVPENTFSLWNRYDFTPNWGVGLGVISSSDQFVAVENVLTPASNVELPGYTRVDAALYWTVNPHLRVQANVENLTDEEYFPNAHNNNNITPGSPLAARIAVVTNF
ncbi:MAG TPA: TonB-dependent siderophore receptor [Steroidobacteraceae bacterium]|nr:TonB-dependent siderophore receptor [Steroidobacteraceae bacterium]